MAINEEYLNYILNQLSEFSGIETKKMFGGIGFFKDGLMFGKIGGDTFRLKVDEENKEEYQNRGMEPYYSEKKKKGMPYWEVPSDIIEDKKLLEEWASKSFMAAKRAIGKKKK